MKTKEIFITIDFGGEKLYDYPKNIPIPRKGERVIFNDLSGDVINVKHIISGIVSEIKIIMCED